MSGRSIFLGQAKRTARHGVWYSLCYAAFYIVGCAPTPYLIFNNGTTDRLIVSVTPQNKRDTKSRTFDAGSVDSLVATAFGKANAVDQAELRAIIVRDSSGSILQVLRMSSSYLIDKKWVLPYPVVLPCDTCGRKLNRATMATDAYHLAQDLYNARKYLECIAMASAGANLDAAQSRRTSKDPFVTTDYDEGYARYQGYLLLLYLCGVKTKNEGLAQMYWDKIEREAPHVARNLRQFDVEISR